MPSRGSAFSWIPSYIRGKRQRRSPACPCADWHFTSTDVFDHYVWPFNVPALRRLTVQRCIFTLCGHKPQSGHLRVLPYSSPTGGNMKLESINPATGELIESFEEISDSNLEVALQRAQQTFSRYRRTAFAERAGWLLRA